MTAAIESDSVAGRPCPVCGSEFQEVIASAEEIGTQIARRRNFFSRRIEGGLGADIETDLVRTARSEASPLVRCHCGTVMRREPSDSDVFRSAEYERKALETLHREHYEYFSTHEVLRRLTPGMSVLEIGSYVGGFLRAAEGVGATVTGVDVSPQVTRFTSDRGFPTICGDFMEVSLERDAFAGIFVWSCFEQLQNPSAALDRIRELLAPRGLLVVRVPDADWYTRLLAQQRKEFRWGQREGDATKAIGYSNLLGFPHLYGFGEVTLKRLVRSKGFSLLSIDRTPPFRPAHDRMFDWALEEERAIIAAYGSAWMELTARLP